MWFLLGLVGLTALAGAAWVIAQVPLPPEAPQAQTSVIYDATGAEVATLHGSENRYPVKLDQIPEVLQQAVVSAEDRKFFSHGGIDPLGIARATWSDIRNKGAVQGGSTITQQYVKNVYVGQDPTLWRKLREAVIAVKLERKLDKRQILERYLNAVYFGRGAYGVQAASQAYFKKDVGQLDLKESAYLAGLIRLPSSADVADDPALATELRGFVLAAMVRDRYITPEQSAEVQNVPLERYVAARPEAGTTLTLRGAGAEYFVEYVQRQLAELYPEDLLLRGGLRINTSLDPVLQRQAWDAVYGTLDGADDPAGALVSLDSEGRVVAMVGGRDFAESQVNLAVGADGGGSGRQAGSTFKPFVLAQIVKEGYSLESAFPGPAKIVLPGADRGTDWEVENYEGASYGTINLVDATADSVNTVYAQLITALGQDGPQKVARMAEQLGVGTRIEPHVSIALGAPDVSVLEMAGAFHTFARDGMRVDPRVITKVTAGDSVLLDDKPRPERVLDRAQVEKINYALEQVVERGSGTRAQVRNTRVWGKTGTSDNNTDAWFVGYTRKLTTAVWMGYREGTREMRNVQGVQAVNGGSLPAEIFKRFMDRAGVNNDGDERTTVPDVGGRILGSSVRPVLPAYQ
ncbi:MAG: penicillin-binding protein, partial [Actinomycetota bacterium]|nr:penicillin-binding protein [Actinomycetota bacterium]